MSSLPRSVPAWPPLLRGRQAGPNGQAVCLGQPCAEILPALLQEFGAGRPLLVTNTSLAGAGGLAERLLALMGPGHAGLVAGIGAHAPMEDVARLVRALGDRQADAIVGLGGGSVASAMKVARLALANGADTVERLGALAQASALELHAGSRVAPLSAIARPALPAIAIPTTLSAGEFTPFAGASDPATRLKQPFAHPALAPDAVILDPGMTRCTPRRLWLATGIRAVAHAVETWCSVRPTPLSDVAAVRSLQWLIPALRACAGERRDADGVAEAADARLACQAGAWQAIQGIAAGVPQGASHGLGHVLGALSGIPHGETSCILLAPVLRHNAETNAARQAALAAQLGWAGPLADGIAALVRDLGLPARLRELAVDRALLAAVAQAASGNVWVKSNPRSLTGRADTLRILESAW